MSQDSLRLRRPEKDDLTNFLEWSNNKELQTVMGWEYPDSKDDLSNWLFDKVQNRNRYFFIIEYQKQAIGDIELCNISWRSGQAEIKICIADKAYWGRGLGKRALDLLLDKAFNTLNLKEVYLRVYAFNKRAIRCYEKTGFSLKGTLRRNDPNWNEIWLMSLTKSKFNRRNQIGA
ncbi:MAG TPA: GNAT family N-acetyltransferase [Firmicutes bacterium]|nr:GNAT family N-acetyltransferase [Bacillota bacterium]